MLPQDPLGIRTEKTYQLTKLNRFSIFDTSRIRNIQTIDYNIKVSFISDKLFKYIQFAWSWFCINIFTNNNIIIKPIS